jgi:SagB-type dehydrogenase family enzyme
MWTLVIGRSWQGRSCLVVILLAVLALSLASCAQGEPSLRDAQGRIRVTTTPQARLALPPPRTTGPLSLEETLARRRSVREFSGSPLTWAEISQLLWAAQGVTSPYGLRTAPSAGALYPLEVYVVTADGTYHYSPADHVLNLVAAGDLRPDLWQVALRQEAVRQAPVVFIIAVVYGRTEQKYGLERTPRYVHLEAGHAAQNLLLQAVALELGAVPIGAFDDAGVQAALSLPAEHQPLYLIPVGHPRRSPDQESRR